MRYLWIPASVFAFVLGHFTMPAPIVVAPAVAPPVVVVADKPTPAPPPPVRVVAPCWYGRPYWSGMNSVPPCMLTNAGCCP